MLTQLLTVTTTHKFPSLEAGHVVVDGPLAHLVVLNVEQVARELGGLGVETCELLSSQGFSKLV